MTTETRNWASTVIAGLAAIGIGCYDAFVNHAGAFSVAGDVGLIFAGLGALGLKAAYDQGVQVPTPPAK